MALYLYVQSLELKETKSLFRFFQLLAYYISINFPIPLFFKTPLFIRVLRIEKWKEVLNYRRTSKFRLRDQSPNSILALFNPLKVSSCSPGIAFSKQIYVISVYNSYIVRKENVSKFFIYEHTRLVSFISLIRMVFD